MGRRDGPLLSEVCEAIYYDKITLIPLKYLYGDRRDRGVFEQVLDRVGEVSHRCFSEPCCSQPTLFDANPIKGERCEVNMAGNGPRWFEKEAGSKRFGAVLRPMESQGPDLWTRCPGCHEMIFNETLEVNKNVCPMCTHHFRLGAFERLEFLCDEGSLEYHDEQLAPTDRLEFVDSKAYSDRIKASGKKTGRNDAFIAASATLYGLPIEIGSFDFRYMGGSMGSVVGEMITRMIERATERKRPCIIISTSGGARMQEGVLSLMQMAKTSAALTRLKDDAGMPYISLLTHPTTGGVAASFAMLGDLILAEPKALIGFAGPRVIKEDNWPGPACRFPDVRVPSRQRYGRRDRQSWRAATNLEHGAASVLKSSESRGRE